LSSHAAQRESRSGEPWFLDAVFYELSVKSFCDSSGDGVGDFTGLADKLDYICDLGADCIWLLPFFPSPLCDDGYDVTDYRAVHPLFGTIDDFQRFLMAAHGRGLRVAAEMVINHTSVDHPWFQAARVAPAGSELRNFYQWSNSPRPGCNSRDSAARGHSACWSWDDAAKAFYWHRFTPYQPDLNYDNPAVQAEMLKVLRFWATLGIDGLCLNGVAYLAERPGAAPPDARQTHAVLKQFRRDLLRDYPHLMLQAGLNAWPSQAAAYFGDGDECHMTPHLPLATRLFLALKQEDRQPLVDILRQTPAPSTGCQWVTLLRNHDELTLALATDEERDYLFQEYAAEASMRLYGGICRRLAPLVDNNRRRIELLFSLLFALPGAPVIYYGDELGMGDNVFLGGRNAVRTPMQWSADRNGGFSRADFARLVLPPVTHPVYGYQAVNVAAQQRDPSSLLHWMRRLIALRKKHPVLARGKLEILEPENRKTIAFLRRWEDSPAASGGNHQKPADAVLVVANLSHVAQPVELDLAGLAGLVPVEMFGRTAFAPIGGSPYRITLAPHGVFWFQLQAEPPSVTRLVPVRTEAVAALPTLPAGDVADNLFSGDIRTPLQRDVLPAFLRSQRWFGGKAREIASVTIADCGRLAIECLTAYQLLLNVEFTGGQRDVYSLPVCLLEGNPAAAVLEQTPALAIARIETPPCDCLLCDAQVAPAFAQWLLRQVAAQADLPTAAGSLKFESTAVLSELLDGGIDQLAIRRGPATSSNSLVLYGRRLLLKLFRRLEVGANPDYEIGTFLTTNERFSRTPPVAGKFEYRRAGNSEPLTLGIFQALVPNQGDGWGHAIDELGRYYERSSARMFAPDTIEPDERPIYELAGRAPPPAALETIAGYLHAAATLGRRTAEMHLALASDKSNPDFAPERLTAADLEQLKSEIAFQADQAFTALDKRSGELPEAISADARRLLEEGPDELALLTAAWNEPPEAAKIRIHGDYHLGQVLWVDNDYVILDFEGEPTRSVAERRAKFSPIRDVAGMLRSYHYAAFAGLFSFTQDRPADFSRLAVWADLWQQWTSSTFLDAWLKTAHGAEFVPASKADLALLLDGFTLAKALYELAYELNNRPDWVRIPLSGVLRLLGLAVPESQQPESHPRVAS
jgi:maltose alpha-D-glucosyltransferase/alpha-amylase